MRVPQTSTAHGVMGICWISSSLDAGYDPIQLGGALAQEAIRLLVRLRSGRCFYAPPVTLPSVATGRPRRHGTTSACANAATWPAPTAEWTQTTSDYGVVRLRAWAGRHAIPQNHAQRGTRQAKPLVTGTLMRWEVARLPRPTKTPLPLRFWWSGPLAPNLATVWQVYSARFAIAHQFRFFKHILKWTTPKLRSPAVTDR